MDETSADIQLYDRPTLGMLRNINNRGIDLVQEVKSQTGSLQLIVLCGIEHFLLGGMQKSGPFSFDSCPYVTDGFFGRSG